MGQKLPVNQGPPWLDLNQPNVLLQHKDLEGGDSVRWVEFATCWDFGGGAGKQYFKFKVAASLKFTEIDAAQAQAIMQKRVDGVNTRDP